MSDKFLFATKARRHKEKREKTKKIVLIITQKFQICKNAKKIGCSPNILKLAVVQRNRTADNQTVNS